jgi:hypothetical protein
LAKAGEVLGFGVSGGVDIASQISNWGVAGTAIDVDLLKGNYGCRRSAPFVYVMSCLNENLETLRLSGSMSCTSGAKAYGKFNAKAKVVVWYVEPEAEFSYDVTRSWSITISVPVPQKPQEFPTTVASGGAKSNDDK